MQAEAGQVGDEQDGSECSGEKGASDGEADLHPVNRATEITQFGAMVAPVQQCCLLFQQVRSSTVRHAQPDRWPRAVYSSTIVTRTSRVHTA